METGIIHHEIDKLVVVHQVKRSDLIRDRSQIHEVIDSLAGHDLFRPASPSPMQRFLCFKNRDITLSVKSTFGQTTVTGMIRTEALHLGIVEAYRRLEAAIHAISWIDGDAHLQALHLSADVMGIKVQDEQIPHIDDRTGMALDTYQPRKSRSGKEVRGGATFRWGPPKDPVIVIYDKVAELNKHRAKSAFMKPLYRERGWDDKAPITRIEVRPPVAALKAFCVGGSWDLTRLWRDFLRYLRFTEEGTQGSVETRPTAAWWSDVIALDFPPPWSVGPVSRSIQVIPKKQAAKQARGTASGALAKLLVVHELGIPDLPSFDESRAESIVTCAGSIDARFVIRVIEKSLEMGLTASAIATSSWPAALKEDVMALWPMSGGTYP